MTPILLQANDPSWQPDTRDLFDTHRFDAFFTTSDLDAATADQTHRQHAIIGQIDADLKDSALAHLPSGVFTVNVTWLVLATIAFNLSRAVGLLAWRGSGQGMQRHHPSQTHQHPRPYLLLRARNHPVPPSHTANEDLERHRQ